MSKEKPSYQLTPEQQAILDSTGNIKINAVAGSGKTSTLIEYAKKQQSGSRILYLAFNRSVRMEAQKKFSDLGLTNVDVQTAHSLAFRKIAIPFGYKIGQGYKIHDIARILELDQVGADAHSAFIIARHVIKFASFFCNSSSEKVQELDYCASISDPHARAAVKYYYAHIEQGTRRFLAKMDKKEIDATHDFYLKKYQLSKPLLPHNVILFDEGQDASPVMLDVFLAQKGKKVVVGDMHQQIYGWRNAVNALKQVEFPSYSLTTSFRFNQHIADLAMECLLWKHMIGDPHDVRITGVGNNKKIESRATVARTNLALLKKAIKTMESDRSVKKIYFEGNISSYTYAADGASIYDVLNLYLDKRTLIRDPLIKTMVDFDALSDYAEKTEDMELSMLLDIVNEYGKDIPYLLKKLTSMHVDDKDRNKADMIFSTLHRCKGMEYDDVTLTEDFITEERIQKMVAREKDEPVDKNKVTEEINLAYVAVTRSKNFLNLPEDMFPDADRSLFEKKKKLALPIKAFQKKRLNLDDKRKMYGNAYKIWTKEEDIQLEKMYYKNVSTKEMATKLGRNVGAINSRLRKLGWED